MVFVSVRLTLCGKFDIRSLILLDNSVRSNAVLRQYANTMMYETSSLCSFHSFGLIANATFGTDFRNREVIMECIVLGRPICGVRRILQYIVEYRKVIKEWNKVYIYPVYCIKKINTICTNKWTFFYFRYLIHMKTNSEHVGQFGI